MKTMKHIPDHFHGNFFQYMCGISRISRICANIVLSVRMFKVLLHFFPYLNQKKNPNLKFHPRWVTLTTVEHPTQIRPVVLQVTLQVPTSDGSAAWPRRVDANAQRPGDLTTSTSCSQFTEHDSMTKSNFIYGNLKNTEESWHIMTNNDKHYMEN